MTTLLDLRELVPRLLRLYAEKRRAHDPSESLQEQIASTRNQIMRQLHAVDDEPNIEVIGVPQNIQLHAAASKDEQSALKRRILHHITRFGRVNATSMDVFDTIAQLDDVLDSMEDEVGDEDGAPDRSALPMFVVHLLVGSNLAELEYPLDKVVVQVAGPHAGAEKGLSEAMRVFPLPDHLGDEVRAMAGMPPSNYSVLGGRGHGHTRGSGRKGRKGRNGGRSRGRGGKRTKNRRRAAASSSVL